MTKKKTRRKAKGTSNKMGRDQSIRFVNALFGYCKEHDVNMSDIAAMCEVPLSQINVWANPAAPFRGTIDKDVMRRFCAAAGIGRDDLMRLAAKDPIVRDVSLDNLEEVPEYAYRQCADNEDIDDILDASVDTGNEVEVEIETEPIRQNDAQPSAHRTSPETSCRRSSAPS